MTLVQLEHFDKRLFYLLDTMLTEILQVKNYTNTLKIMILLNTGLKELQPKRNVVTFTIKIIKLLRMSNIALFLLYIPLNYLGA